jgi:hypothetical protein
MFKKGDSMFKIKRIIVVLVLATVVMMALCLVKGIEFAYAASPCKDTSQATYQSCLSEASADYWLTIAKCDNLPTPQEVAACKAQARKDKRDEIQSCEDQLKARLQVCVALGGGIYNPVINPANFSTTIDNPYLPLTPGKTFIYEATTESGTEHIEVHVTNDTKVIMGVECIVVRDTVTVNGVVAEDTLDWYAQDTDGNVWYFGEESKEYEDGDLVSLSGSFKAGKDMALPGIVMKGDPKVGDIYRQEYAIGEAEDMGQVLSLNASATVPYGSFNDCLETKDFSPSEPDVVEHKFYAPGIGVVLEETVQGGTERVELIEIMAE